MIPTNILRLAHNPVLERHVDRAQVEILASNRIFPETGTVSIMKHRTHMAPVPSIVFPMLEHMNSEVDLLDNNTITHLEINVDMLTRYVTTNINEVSANMHALTRRMRALPFTSISIIQQDMPSFVAIEYLIRVLYACNLLGTLEFDNDTLHIMSTCKTWFPGRVKMLGIKPVNVVDFEVVSIRASNVCLLGFLSKYMSARHIHVLNAPIIFGTTIEVRILMLWIAHDVDLNVRVCHDGGTKCDADYNTIVGSMKQSFQWKRMDSVCFYVDFSRAIPRTPISWLGSETRNNTTHALYAYIKGLVHNVSAHGLISLCIDKHILTFVGNIYAVNMLSFWSPLMQATALKVLDLQNYEITVNVDQITLPWSLKYVTFVYNDNLEIPQQPLQNALMTTTTMGAGHRDSVLTLYDFERTRSMKEQPSCVTVVISRGPLKQRTSNGDLAGVRHLNIILPDAATNDIEYVGTYVRTLGISRETLLSLRIEGRLNAHVMSILRDIGTNGNTNEEPWFPYLERLHIWIQSARPLTDLKVHSKTTYVMPALGLLDVSLSVDKPAEFLLPMYTWFANIVEQLQTGTLRKPTLSLRRPVMPRQTLVKDILMHTRPHKVLQHLCSIYDQYKDPKQDASIHSNMEELLFSYEM